MSDWADGLNPRQKAFVLAYATTGGNASRAATEAGYKNPGLAGHRLIKNDKVIDAIRLRAKATDSPKIATLEQRQEFWSNVMYGNIDDLNPPTGDGEAPTMPLWSDRLRASEDLGRSQGDFLDRTEHTGGGGEPLTLSLYLPDNKRSKRSKDDNGDA